MFRVSRRALLQVTAVEMEPREGGARHRGASWFWQRVGRGQDQQGGTEGCWEYFLPCSIAAVPQGPASGPLCVTCRHAAGALGRLDSAAQWFGSEAQHSAWRMVGARSVFVE